ncbi:A/G-specific adenine glycosylase [Candidatus Bealeia paramacronuclearis]|uniref:Adenine DNA glycosylase n=1 Tax=Candidatus Bealeia paramacronuclearis TaxID=1921001 RepID=A0ABZ2C878_9PROT
MMVLNSDSFSQDLFQWFDGIKRDLPWRKAGGHANPYHVWLSEIMLQQTTVKSVIPYFLNFIQRWPTIEDLGRANLDEVLHAWQGLGYYTRAKNLHKCAQMIVGEFGGRFPEDRNALLKLPGIGPYTSAAITSIAFEKPAIALDGNVMRVISRYLTLESLRPQLDQDAEAFLWQVIPQSRFGDFTQALMELGALMCRPKSPMCLHCPLMKNCKAYLNAVPEDFPKKVLKKALPQKFGHAFLLKNSNHQILIRKRAGKGILSGLYEVPTTDWDLTLPKRLLQDISLPEHLNLRGEVNHTFTHFHLNLKVWEGATRHPIRRMGRFLKNLKDYALPTLMKKVLSL